MPLRSESGNRHNVISSVTTKAGGATFATFTAQYADALGRRTGQDSGSSSGMGTGSWTRLLNLGDGVKFTVGSTTIYGLVTAN